MDLSFIVLNLSINQNSFVLQYTEPRFSTWSKIPSLTVTVIIEEQV